LVIIILRDCPALSTVYSSQSPLTLTPRPDAPVAGLPAAGAGPACDGAGDACVAGAESGRVPGAGELHGPPQGGGDPPARARLLPVHAHQGPLHGEPQAQGGEEQRR
jgi:hypothetical protein